MMDRDPGASHERPVHSRPVVIGDYGDIDDEQLVELVREGTLDAFAELYHRHTQIAAGVARKNVDNLSDADDVVAEAFASTFEYLTAGRGPRTFFRGYLLTAVTRIAHRRNRNAGSTLLTDDFDALGVRAIDDDAMLRSFEDSAITAAFKTLPERWQSVLWYVDIERMKPAAVASLLSVSPNAVSSLARRAREGLFQAYLQGHVAGANDSVCAPFATALGAYVRQGLGRSATLRIDAHLMDCAECTTVVEELADVKAGLRAVILPLITGVAFGVPGAGTKGVLASKEPGKATLLIRRLSPRISGKGAWAVAVAAVAAIVVAAAQGIGAWSPAVDQQHSTVSAGGGTAAPTGQASAFPPLVQQPSLTTAPAPSGAPSAPAVPSPQPSPPSAAEPSALADPPASVQPPTFPAAPPSQLAPGPSPSPMDDFPTLPAHVAGPLVESKGSGLCLTLPAGGSGRMGIADCFTGGDSQAWAYDSSKQTFSTVVGGSEYCLDADGSGTENGTRVIGWSCTGQPNQRWLVDGNNATIIGVPSNRCLAIVAGPAPDGALLNLWDCIPDVAGQKWTVGSSTP